MADITVTCTNDKNVSIAFRWDWDNNPFHLLGLDGIYGYDCNVTTSENTTTDGSTYQGSTAKERNIVITAEIDGDYRKNRELLYRVFPKGRTGTLEYSEDGDIKTITYRVESVTPGATTGVVRDYTISLICTDPYFKDLSDVEVVMASWVSDWYFENGLDGIFAVYSSRLKITAGNPAYQLSAIITIVNGALKGTSGYGAAVAYGTLIDAAGDCTETHVDYRNLKLGSISVRRTLNSTHVNNI